MKIESFVRKVAGTHNNIKVVILPQSDIPPTVKGQSYHWTNKSGDIIRYPSAYARKFGRPIYNPSTLRLVVGKKWITQELQKEREKLDHAIKLQSKQLRNIRKALLEFGPFA